MSLSGELSDILEKSELLVSGKLKEGSKEYQLARMDLLTIENSNMSDKHVSIGRHLARRLCSIAYTELETIKDKEARGKIEIKREPASDTKLQKIVLDAIKLISELTEKNKKDDILISNDEQAKEHNKEFNYNDLLHI